MLVVDLGFEIAAAASIVSGSQNALAADVEAFEQLAELVRGAHHGAEDLQQFGDSTAELDLNTNPVIVTDAPKG